MRAITMKILQYLATITILLAFLLLACNPMEKGYDHELEVQKRQWKMEIGEDFPNWTTDTVEMENRLAHFRKSGNKMGEQAMLRMLGNEFRNSSRFQPAIEKHTQALQIAYELNDTVLITTLLNELGTDFRRTGIYEEAIKYHYQSLQLSENYMGSDVKTITRNIASSLNGVGIVYSTMNEPDEAIQAYEKALEIEIGKHNLKGMAMNHANIGSAYFDKEEFDKAESYFHKSLQNNIDADLPLGIALCNINIGRIHETRGEQDTALEQYQLAYNILSEMPDKWHWIKSGLHLGEAYMKTGDYQRAHIYLDEALQTAFELKSPAYIQEAYELLSRYNYHNGNYKQSADELRLSQLYADSVRYNLETSRLLESRIKYETEKFTRQIEELDRQNQEQVSRKRHAILMMVALLVVLTGLLLLILYKRKLEQQQAVELKNLEKMRSNFFTNLTHELRTPITVINGLSKHLMSEMDDLYCTDAKDLQAIQRQGNHLLHLVNQLLEFSRSESGIVKPKWRYANIVEYINVLTESYTQYARNKGIEMFVYSEEPVISMNFAPSSVKKVMDNLLSNAIKNCTEGNRIIVHIQHNRATQKCLIMVKDSGKGIASEELPNIFKLYYSVDPRHGQTSSGIGLALTKQLINEMGGSINVTSTPGEGAEFTVTLPISDRPIPLEEREELHYDPTEINGAPQSDDKNDDLNFTPTSANGKKTILVIEDNKDVIHYISTILSDQYMVIHASNGNEGLLMAEQHIPDLIITDVMMPEKDGYRFTADLRNSLAISHIPVIIITAKGSTEEKLQGLKSGADAFLTKPFDEQELKVRIQQLLKSRTMLMETYTAAFLQESKNTVVDSDHNMTFITKLSIEVNNHLDDPQYFPDGLSSDMCLSESQLNRKLKAMTGHTISSFVMRARLNKAKQLLSKRQMNITEVALTCGFSDLSYFSRSFKKVFGYTPSEFMKIPEKQEE